MRDYGRSSSQKGYMRRHTLEWKREVESTVTVKKKKEIRLGFSQHMNAVFPTKQHVEPLD